jgi:hypothetical protein
MFAITGDAGCVDMEGVALCMDGIVLGYELGIEIVVVWGGVVRGGSHSRP